MTPRERYQRFVECVVNLNVARVKLVFASTEIDVDRPHRIEIDEILERLNDAYGDLEALVMRHVQRDRSGE